VHEDSDAELVHVKQLRQAASQRAASGCVQLCLPNLNSCTIALCTANDALISFLGRWCLRNATTPRQTCLCCSTVAQGLFAGATLRSSPSGTSQATRSFL
jgi:hypothetical protein